MAGGYFVESFTERERAILAPHFTNLDGPVFALVDLPEVVKGALFARYSRSAKSLRRLFLDEFVGEIPAGAGRPAGDDVGVGRAERLYERMLGDYGDDSVAQLGGVHLACEQSSQLLAKVLERGRLAAYLEQSTRYVPLTDKPGGRWRYHVPAEVETVPRLAASYRAALDRAFEVYARWLEPMQELYRERFPRQAGDSEGVHRATIRAKACDTLRGLLPVATRTNVGIYATAQSYERLILRMRAHPLAEVRDYGELVLAELRKVIPDFLARLDRPERGGAWVEYLRRTREASEQAAAATIAWDATASRPPGDGPEVTLTDFDPDGEVKVAAAILFASTGLSDEEALKVARAVDVRERGALLDAYAGERSNRRHKPGRAFERTSYRFDVVCDYGAFRDLQRHRTLSIEWQRMAPAEGFETPDEVGQVGAGADWAEVMERAAALWSEVDRACGPDAAQYALAMAYRVRFCIQMNAREAMHLIELRSSPQGHPAYRRVAQRMHELIAERAGHRRIAAAMSFVDHSHVDLERLKAERRLEARREGRPG